MIAVDTNVLIYCCDRGDVRRQQIALDLVSRAEDGVLLWQVAAEFIAASRKLSTQGFSAAAAWQRLADFLDLFPLVLPTTDVLGHARRLHAEQQIAFDKHPPKTANNSHEVAATPPIFRSPARKRIRQ